MTVPSFVARKGGKKLTMLTAYDHPTAKILDECGIDAILVGDSCANAVMGRPNTLTMSIDEMVHHSKMVNSAVTDALVIADMPFMTYHVSVEEAVRNAGRLIQEGDAQAVKLEGPPHIFGDTITAIRNAGIPVMGHLGLTPQSIHVLGGHKRQARTPEAQAQLEKDAKGLDELGCFGVVLECVPADVAAQVTQSISCPTIGIGAGHDTDGQVLVMHDILGWGFTSFTKTFVDVKAGMAEAFTAYINEVQSENFPGKEHQFS
jgi:3-methyl-2-oxobutanoate hydroxymethyltransferase